MERLLKGMQRFKDTVFHEKQSFFQSLSEGQTPRALFITCSDSRVVPTLITQTEPGELFVLRNAGNIIPPYLASNGGEEATIEYAIGVLHVKHIIVCGHSSCGAIDHLLSGEIDHSDNHIVSQWLAYAESAKQITEALEPENNEQRLELTIRNNVRMQLKHIETYPCVAKAIAKKELDLHGWYYCMETGDIDVFINTSVNPA